MEYEDYKSHFHYTSICRVVDTHKYCYKNFPFTHDPYFIIPVNIPERGEYAFCVAQKPEMAFNTDWGHKCGYTRMIIFKAGANYLDQPQYIAGNWGDYEKHDVWIEFTTIEAGDYFIFVNVDWDGKTSDDNKDFTICTYGIRDVTIGDQSMSMELGDRSKFIDTIFKAKANQLIANPALRDIASNKIIMNKTIAWTNSILPVDASFNSNDSTYFHGF